MHIFKEWKYKKEILTSRGQDYNVDSAKQILNKKPRESVYFPIEDLRDKVDRTLKGRHFNNRRANLKVPIIVITRKDGSEEVIDGWHRLEKALRLGYTVLPAVRLNRSETEKVRIKKKKCIT